MKTILLWAALAASAGTPQTGALGSDPPEIHGETINGKPIELPKASAGKVTVLILGFSRQGGQQTGGWEEQLNRDFGRDSRVAVYTIAVLKSAPGLLRGVIKAGIRSGTPAAKRDHMVTTTSGEAAWKKYVGVSDTKVPGIVLLDSSGRTRWIGQGTFEPGQYEVLKAAVKKAGK